MKPNLYNFFKVYTNATSREETIKSIAEYKNSYAKIVDKYKVSKLKISLKISKDSSDIKVPAILIQKEGNQNMN